VCGVGVEMSGSFCVGLVAGWPCVVVQVLFGTRLCWALAVGLVQVFERGGSENVAAVLPPECTVL